VERGESVVIFDLVKDLKLLKEEANQVKVTQGDITDFYQLLHTVKDEQVDHIIHMAYFMGPANPSKSFKVNLIGTFNVLEAARIMEVKKLVFTSSWQVYGDVSSSFPVSEDSPKIPKTIYGAGKLALEIWGECYSRTYGLDFTALRFSKLYGPGRSYSPYAHLEVDQIVMNSVHGKPSRIFAGGEKTQWLYLKDLARAVLLASSCVNPKRRILNIGSEEYFSLREVANFVKKLIPSAKIEIVPQKEKTSSSLVLDYKAAREELGYAQKYTMTSGLKDYIDTVRSSK